MNSSKFRVVQQCPSHRIISTIGLWWLIFIALGIITSNGWLGAFFAAGTLSILWRGISAQVETNDPTIFRKIYRRPAWLRWASVAGMSFSALMWIYEFYLTNWVFSIAGIAGTILYARRTLARSSDHPVTSTDEQVAHSRIHSSMFASAGLTWKSPKSGQTVYPRILASGFDDRDRPVFDVEIIAGRQTVKDFRKAADRIASAWPVPHVEVSEPAPHIARITGFFGEPGLVGEVIWRPIPVWQEKPSAANPAGILIPVADYVSRLPMGELVMTNEPWLMNAAQRNIMIAGIPGSGKSSYANALLAHLAPHPHIRLAILDLKFGAEAGAWLPRLDHADDNADGEAGIYRALEFFEAANKDLAARYGRMKAVGVTNAWTQGFLGENEPIKVLVVDECSEMYKSSTPERAKLARRLIEAQKSYIQQGRAAGFLLILMTQFPKEPNLPSEIREVASDSIGFRVKTEKGTHAIFGYEYVPESAMGDPTKISAQGQAVVVNAEFDGERIQMAWLDKATQDAIVAANAHLKRQWLDAPMVQPGKATGDSGQIPRQTTGRPQQEAPDSAVESAQPELPTTGRKWSV